MMADEQEGLPVARYLRPEEAGGAVPGAPGAGEAAGLVHCRGACGDPTGDRGWGCREDPPGAGASQEAESVRVAAAMGAARR